MSLVRKKQRTSFTEIEVRCARRADRLIFENRYDEASMVLRQAGLTMDDIDWMDDHGLLMPEEDWDTKAVTAVAPSAPAAPSAQEAPFVELPDGSDLADPHLRAKVESHVRQAYGHTFMPLWPLGADPVDGVKPRVPVINSRPGAQVIALGDDVGPTHGAKVAEAGKARGLGDLVAFDPYAKKATFAHLPDSTRQTREAIARELGVRDVWDVEILVGRDLVIVLRAPALSNDEKRVERWTALARTLLPAGIGEKWIVKDEPTTGRLYLHRIQDRLLNVQDYDWNAAVDLHHLPFGVREDGSRLTLGLLEVNMLLGGTPGGGKSGGLTALLCGIARLENVALVGLDPKRVEQKPWTSRFTRIAKEEDGATDVLERLRDEMERRYEWLEDMGLKKFGPAQFTKEQPLLVLVIDELADLVSVGVSPDEKKAEAERSTLIRRLIAKGRAAGIVVIAATQKPQSDVVPTALRDLIQLRVAYATTNSDMTDTILGKGMSQNGGDAATISAKQRGVCYVVNETSRNPNRARTYWVPDEDVEAIAQKYAHLRVDLPWMMESGPSVARPGPAPSPDAVTPIDLSDWEPPAVVQDLADLTLSLDDLEEIQ